MRPYLRESHSDFSCKHCGYRVSAQQAFSGVVNRNHCPYCLFSQHVDLYTAGDRLCACKGLMSPVGLTFKKSRDKYTASQKGELMLVHCCTQCGYLSINRVAADDDPLKLLAVFNLRLPELHHIEQICQQQGIQLLSDTESSLVNTRLFGAPTIETADILFTSWP